MWRHLVAKFCTNASGATWWLNVVLMEEFSRNSCSATCWLNLLAIRYLQLRCQPMGPLCLWQCFILMKIMRVVEPGCILTHGKVQICVWMWLRKNCACIIWSELTKAWIGQSGLLKKRREHWAMKHAMLTWALYTGKKFRTKKMPLCTTVHIIYQIKNSCFVLYNFEKHTVKQLHTAVRRVAHIGGKVGEWPSQC